MDEMHDLPGQARHWHIERNAAQVKWRCSDGRTGSEIRSQPRSWVVGFTQALTLCGHTFEYHERGHHVPVVAG